MDRGALQHPLEPGSRLDVFVVVADQALQFCVHIVAQILGKLVHIHIAGAQDRDRVLIVGQREQQMLERREFVVPVTGVAERPMEGLFKVL